MKTYIQKGELLDYTNNTGADIASGAVIVHKSGPSGFIGVAEDTIVNLAVGASRVAGVVQLPALTTDTGVVGDAIYWDSGNIRLTRTRGTNTYAGRLALDKAGTDTTANVALNLRSEAAAMLFAAVVASTAVTNTTVETAFDQSVTLAANALRAGDVIRIIAQGIATATNSTDTLTVKLYIGGTVIVATAALDVANNDLFTVSCDLVVRTDGAGGTIVAFGSSFIGTPGTASSKPYALASTAIDTTAAQLIKATATWSVANAGDSCRLDVLNVERIG